MANTRQRKAIFFIMTLSNFIRMVHARRRFGRQRLTDIWRISPLLSTFVRDGTVFYLMYDLC